MNLLVDDGIKSNSSLSSLTIADDEFSLSSSNWHQTINSLQTSLHGLIDGFTGDNSWSLELDSSTLATLHWALSVDGVTEGVKDTTKHFRSDGHIDDGSSSLDDITLLDLSINVKDMMYLSLPKTTIPTLSVSKFKAIPLTPELNSTISPA